MSQNEQRIQILSKLLDFEASLSSIQERLSAHVWDFDEELVVLTPAHVVRVLQRYLNCELQAWEVEAWAEMIECRDDIGMADSQVPILKDVVFELANPSLTATLSRDSAETLLARLQA